MKIKNVLSSQVAATVLIALLAILANLKYKQWKDEMAVEKLKNDLLQQADSQQKKNKELSSSIQYLNSSNFKEQVARTQLNLKKDGEVVYTVSENQTATVTAAHIADHGGSNAKKWWNYFFNPGENENISS